MSALNSRQVLRRRSRSGDSDDWDEMVSALPARQVLRRRSRSSDSDDWDAMVAGLPPRQVLRRKSRNSESDDWADIPLTDDSNRRKKRTKMKPERPMPFLGLVLVGGLFVCLLSSMYIFRFVARHQLSDDGGRSDVNNEVESKGDNILNEQVSDIVENEKERDRIIKYLREAGVNESSNDMMVDSVTFEAMLEAMADVTEDTDDHTFEELHPAQLNLNLDEGDDDLFPVKPNKTFVVSAMDIIMRRERSRPIVIPEYKLVFFHVAKVASTTWIMLFQRILNITDANATLHLHHPFLNQLEYLSPNNLEFADQVIRDPTWTKAIFVRNPHERLVSAYLDKGSLDFAWIRWSCCPEKQDCMTEGSDSFEDFVNLLPNCTDVHWVPHMKRMEPKYWKYINFVGHMDHMSQDGEALLRRIGAWDKYKASWDKNGNGTDPLFVPYGQHHATGAREKLKKYFPNQALFDRVSKYYEEDYNNTILGLAKPKYEDLFTS